MQTYKPSNSNCYQSAGLPSESKSYIPQVGGGTIMLMLDMLWHLKKKARMCNFKKTKHFHEGIESPQIRFFLGGGVLSWPYFCLILIVEYGPLL